MASGRAEASRIKSQVRLPRVTGVDDKPRRSELNPRGVGFRDAVDAWRSGVGVDDVPRDRAGRIIPLVSVCVEMTGSSAGSPEGRNDLDRSCRCARLVDQRFPQRYRGRDAIGSQRPDHICDQDRKRNSLG